MDIKKILKGNLSTVMLKPLKQIYSDVHYAAMHIVPEEWYLKYRFEKEVGYSLNLENPQTFNEKLQWLKLHDHNPLYTKIVDKYEAKKYVADIIGEEYIIPTLGVWNHFDEINFDLLPEQFVLKCTHDSGSVVVCPDKNKLDKKAARKKIENGLRHNYYYSGGFEWPYKNVKPRIIAEKSIGNYPSDYKFFFFDGIIDSIMVCEGREFGYPNFSFYTKKWERIYYQHKRIEPAVDIVQPKGLNLMINLAEKLAKNFSHVRVDFYNLDGKIYFGEYTLYNSGGFDIDITYETDLYWGNKVSLPLE